MEKVFNIVSKKVTGVILTGDEEQMFREWFAISENQAIFKELEQVWHITGDVSIQLNCDVNEEWNLFKAKTQIESNKIRPLFSKQIRRIASLAASIVVLAGLLGILLLNRAQTFVYQTAEQNQKIELPDNSVVWLNAHSQLKVQKNFNAENRNVALIGEAFFEVAKNKNFPFIVEMPNGLQAKVLGTSFNIQAHKNNKVWALNVYTGKVWIAVNDDNALVVEKEQQVLYNTRKKILTKHSTFNANAVAWKTNELKFDNTPIEEVATQLSQFLGKQVVLPSQNVQLRYSGSFLNPTEKDLAKVIALAMGWQYKITNKSLIFTEKADK
jgi:ferric-dicitrate binding protein FerR (iron transport regulator)